MSTEEKDIVTDESVQKFEHNRIIVDGNQAPLRLDKFLMGRLEKLSRSKIQAGIQNGEVRINDKEVNPNYKVRPHDIVTIVLDTEPKERTYAQPEEMDLDIRYEDDDLIVLYKPAGLVVHPGVGNYTGTLVNGLVHYINSMKGPVLPGNDLDRPYLVHRIDKNTSGLLVIAKTDEAMSSLSKQFFDHSIDREYQAIVLGTPEPEKGSITGSIGRSTSSRTKMQVFDEDSGIGKPAVTHYEVLRSYYYVSLVQCKLETGRTHQIRVHFSDNNNPIFNDDKYDGDRIRKGTVFTNYKMFVKNCFDILPRQALHAKSLGFIHPTTKEYMKFDTELPTEMQAVLDKWEHYVTHQKQKL